MITVFTPTFNRASLLPRLYKSLCKQTYRDFEWLVIDDGSSDHTKEILDQFVKENKISIRYYYKTNGGKHTAINLGLDVAKGEIFFIADSDDVLLPDSLSIVNAKFTAIMNDKTFAGVCGLDVDFKGNIIGSGLPKSVSDSNSTEIRSTYHVKGDLKEVFKTEILREFRFPQIIGETFFPELFIWNRIAAKYKIRYFNKPIYMVEYQATGLSSSIVRMRMQSPVASMMTYSDMLTYNMSFKLKLRAIINYWRFWCCRKPGVAYPKIGWRWYWCCPLGVVMHIRDIFRQK